jgi:hypothetical protein
MYNNYTDERCSNGYYKITSNRVPRKRRGATKSTRLFPRRIENRDTYNGSNNIVTVYNIVIISLVAIS